ncbi:bifunctional nuclease family protein [Dysgonomonas sp. 511]|uniref:bifunctional nuclease family protein n=1 Tax=Dysgonomonas sp. 511 TaxID=2302930 RepID=UPI0013CF6299|nr:bifunctional nuclease family protein [Dysgonomonas sp. 511]NDV79212.1 hypothetical protein [Dysgonomonas sp. 511]
MSKKVRLSVLGFSFNQTQSGAYGLVLAEEEGLRRLMVVVGAPEAQSIAFQLQGSVPPRPLTHDLFKTLLGELNIRLSEVEIYKYDNGVFFSKIRLVQGEQHIEIESRTSDAIAIALRTKSPIYTTELIMQMQGVIFDEGNNDDNSLEEEKSDFALDYSLLDKNELESLLNDAVAGEDYELASLIRDELRKKE